MGRAEDARAAWGCITRLYLSDVMHDRVRRACFVIGLPHPGALRLLLMLDADDPPPQRTIASMLGCDASYVTALVDALEAPGFVTRRPAPGDRRIKLVAITTEGEAAREKAFEVVSEPPDSFRRLSASELRELATLLGRAIAAPET